MSNIELLPCPFCGHSTPEFERLGTGKQSCIVACGNCGCRHESGDEWDDCGRSWNTRAIESQSAQIAALTAQRDALTNALLAFRSAGIDLGWGAHPKWFHLIQRCDEALAARASLNPTSAKETPT